MRTFGFKAPQERLGPRFFKSEQDYTNVNTGRFVRNSVLSGMTYGGNDLVPSFLKTCDAVHPLCGSEDFDGVTQSCYGALLDSVNNATTKAAIKSVVQPWNTGVVWAPGGTGVDAWLAVRLPEVTLVESYVLVSTASTCPLSFKIQGSLDGSTWADLHIVENSGVWESGYTEKTFVIPEASRGAYLWYRFYVTASNATTMSIRNLRLLRAASVCARGQLAVDASAGNPLALSFMDGFAADGVTPVDHVETLSAAIVQAPGYFDSYGTPITGITTPTPVDVYAKRGAGGAVTIELNVAGSEDVPYLPGRMTSYAQNGMIVTTTSAVASNNFDPFQSWGSAGYINWSNGSKGGQPQSTLKRFDGEPMFVTKIVGTNCDSNTQGGSSTKLFIEELDGTTTQALVKGSSYTNISTNVLNRYVKSLRRNEHLNYAVVCASAAVYGPKSPLRYRFTGGKMYQRDTADGAAWEAVQKIKLGTFVTNGTDFYQLSPVKPLSIWGMTAGDAMTYLDA